MKNRNVHSLSLVLPQEGLPSSPPSSSPTHAIEQSTSSADHAGRVSLSSRTNSYTPSSNTPFSQALSAESLSLALRSKSAIFKTGVITPITPSFSPAARGHPVHHTNNQQHSGCELQVNGKQNMEAQISRNSPLACGTPVSLDEKSPALWQNNRVVSQAQAQPVCTYASLSNLPTPPPSDSPFSLVLFPEVSSENLQNSNVLGCASYLASLIPTCASASPPSIQLLQIIVHRFSLRHEAIALAGIILDTLSSQFVRKWRTELSRLCVWDLSGCGMSEILALVALGIAAKWIEDRGVSLTAGALSDISDGKFGRREIVATERLMLAEVGWNLMDLSSESDVNWAMEDMARCIRDIEQQ